MSNKMDVHFSSATDQWSTPQDFFDKCNAEFGPFTLDVCADAENTKVSHFYFSEEDNGLEMDWSGHGSIAARCWMNPPYGRGIGAWVQKAYEESQKGCLVVCLLPARTDTKWFHDYCQKGEVRFIKGRLKFGGSKNSAPFPSMLVIFRPQ